MTETPKPTPPIAGQPAPAAPEAAPLPPAALEPAAAPEPGAELEAEQLDGVAAGWNLFPSNETQPL